MTRPQDKPESRVSSRILDEQVFVAALPRWSSSCKSWETGRPSKPSMAKVPLSVRHQSNPSSAYLHQVAIFARHRLVEKFLDFLRWNSGLPHRLGQVIDDTKIVPGDVKYDADFGMFGCHLG
jgi:hypothetical protein